jgi:hypothetical protein
MTSFAKYELAVKAEKQPLTQKERRGLIGLPPFDDERDDEVWVNNKRIYPVEAAQPAPGAAPVDGQPAGHRPALRRADRPGAGWHPR